MIRASLTFFVATLLVVLVGTPVLLIGLVYPAPVFMTWGSAFWLRVILVIAGVRVRVEGTEHLAEETSKFFVGNHQSALDIPILVAVLHGRIRFMAKEALFRIPLFGWIIRRYGHVPIDRSHPRATFRTLRKMIERLERRPISFAVFPEGTRSPDGRLLPFRKGTMKICQRAGLSVVPFAIHGSLAVHERGRFRVRPGVVRIVFAKPIPASEVTGLTGTELHDRVREAVACGLARLRPAASTQDVIAISAEGT